MKKLLSIIFFSLLICNLSFAETIDELEKQAIDAGVKVLNQDESGREELIAVVEKAQSIKVDEDTDKKIVQVVEQIAKLGSELL